MTTESHEATDTFHPKELSQDNFTIVAQVQRITLEEPVTILPGEELSIEPVSSTEAVVTVYNAEFHMSATKRMKIKVEEKV